MCGKFQYVKSPDSKRGKIEKGPDQGKKKNNYIKKSINKKMNRNVYFLRILKN